MTSDPSGFTDGPNLYAYVRNNPLRYVDPTGLQAEPVHLGVGDDYAMLLTRDPPNTTYVIRFWGVEKTLQHGVYNVGVNPTNPLLGIGYINGMNTEPARAAAQAKMISEELGDVSIKLVYNCTMCVPLDLGRCCLGVTGIADSGAVQLLGDTWMDFFKQADPAALYLQYCFSEGAIVTNNALNKVPKELAKRIYVVAIAPGQLISSDSCYYAINYVTKDPVTVCGFAAAVLCGSGTQGKYQFEKLPANSPGFLGLEHNILSGTYLNLFTYHHDDVKLRLEGRVSCY